MRFVAFALLGGLAAIACKADPPQLVARPAPSTAALDLTPLPGAPAVADIAGWWIVDERFQAPMDEPAMRPGSAWFFSDQVLRLVFGDATDRRKIERVTTTNDALRISVEGSEWLVTRRTGGIAAAQVDDGTRIPLRRATKDEVAAIEAADKKRGRMLDRACEKAMECCMAARAKGVAKEKDCVPLTGPPDLSMCIQAIQVFKNKASKANVTLPECLPDK